jgi:large subunit ribosomal protein L25
MAAEQVQIVAEPRSGTGKGIVGRLRAEGRVPAVVYGAEVESTPVHVNALELFHALHTEAGANVLINLQVDGDEHLTIVREVQRHPVRGDLLHVDFVALQSGIQIRVEVPVHLEGADDVAAPGVVQQVLYTVPLMVRPLDIPSAFTLEISEMVIGDTLRVEDIELPEGAEFDIEPERTVVTVVAPTIIEEPTEETPEEAAGELPEEAPIGDAAEGAPVGGEGAEPEDARAEG